MPSSNWTVAPVTPFAAGSSKQLKAWSAEGAKAAGRSDRIRERPTSVPTAPEQNPAMARRAARHQRQVASADLPLQLTPFVGRRSEIEQVVTALKGARLVTLTGPAPPRPAVSCPSLLWTRSPKGAGSEGRLSLLCCLSQRRGPQRARQRYEAGRMLAFRWKTLSGS